MAALLANLAALVLARQFNQPLDQLNWFFLSRVAVISCVAGAFVYAGLLRWTKRALVWFVFVGFVAGALASVWVATHPLILTRSVNPLPFVIAITAVVAIPILAGALPRPVEHANA